MTLNGPFNLSPSLDATGKVELTQSFHLVSPSVIVRPRAVKPGPPREPRFATLTAMSRATTCPLVTSPRISRSFIVFTRGRTAPVNYLSHSGSGGEGPD